MSSIVQKIHKKNSVSRNVFDLSNNIDFVTCAGQLLPVRCDEVMPNSEWRFNQSYFLRTLPLVVPSFARMKVHFDNFFVPYRLLGTDVQSIIVGNNRGMISNYNGASYTSSNKCLPYTSLFDLSILQNVAWSKGSSANLSDAAGYSQQKTSPVLLNALGYGVPAAGTVASEYTTFLNNDNGNINEGNELHSVVSSTFVQNTVNVDGGVANGKTVSLAASIMPLLAYQKIYQDYYRNKLWENENRSSYFIQTEDYGSHLTLDDLRSRGILEMRYHDLDKDRILGCVPDVSSVLSQGLTINQSQSNDGAGLDAAVGPTTKNGRLGPELVPGANTAGGSSITSLSMNMVAFRRLEAFQKFAEITELNKNDYKHQVAAHFGFSPSDLNSDYCQYLGGFEDIVNISDVENTTSSEPASLSGKGVSSGSSRQFSFRAQEHGIIMTICYIVPLVDYSNLFVERYCTRLNRYDFVQPEFDSIGFEPLRLFDVYNEYSNVPVGLTALASITSSSIVGYLPRYWSYKTKLDIACSPFYNSENKETNLNYGSYIIRYPYERLVQNFATSTFYKALKAIPSLTDNLFAVSYDGNIENSPFVVTFYDNCSAMLPLSVSGLPY